MKNVNGDNIIYNIGEKIREENFPIVAGSPGIVQLLLESSPFK
jgi:hypothetical protein